MINNIRIEDIGKRQGKFRILFTHNGDEQVLSRTFTFKKDALTLAYKLKTKQESILR